MERVAEAREDESEGTSEGTEFFFADSDLDSEERASILEEVSYVALSMEVVQLRQKESVQMVCSVLSMGQDEAHALLRLCGWDCNLVNDRWFGDNEAIREAAGIVDLPKTQTPSRTCGICFEEREEDELCSTSCGHRFCKGCWRQFLEFSIDEGPLCLMARCPTPECNAFVPKSMVESMVSESHLKRYTLFWSRSYVEESQEIKWCPGPGCDRAIHCPGGGSEALDILCECGYSFCWACQEEAHRPVHCKIVHKWLVKNSAESENLVWILANSKPCPKCKRPIQKGLGCMHMTCSAPCRHEFCWLCLEPWSQHSEQTGGFYQCNRYDKAREKGQYRDEELRRNNAKGSLERYMHYFERWDAHDKARKAAQKDLERLSSSLESLSSTSASTISQLRFYSDAYSQIIECRRILKWTYAYGYYHFMDSGHSSQQEFLEFIQGEAEMSLEKLHHVAETNVESLIENPVEFNMFRSRLTGLTHVTRDYFEKLVAELEQGLHHLSTRYSESPGTSLSQSFTLHESSPEPSPIQQNSRKLETLVSLGFEVDEAQVALQKCNGNEEEAMTILLAGLNVSDSQR